VKVQHVEVDGYYFYRVNDVFPKTFLKKLLKSSTYWLEKTRKDPSEEVYPPEASGRLFEHKEFTEDPIWIRYYKTLDEIVSEYAKLVEIPMDYLSRHASWITRIKDLNFPNKFNAVHKAYLANSVGKDVEWNMHAHVESDPITTVFYLKTPHRKYGTVIKRAGGQNMFNPGDENSMIIFDGRLFHSAQYPPIKVAAKSPRYTIVADYEFKYGMHVKEESFKRKKPVT
tara:strand:+ start:2813 stop:3493 length:681 start_codon:yes stop_codon:yes gene_type:complete